MFLERVSGLQVSPAECKLFKDFGLNSDTSLSLKEQKSGCTQCTCDTAVRGLQRLVCLTAPETFKQLTFSLGGIACARGMFY